MALWFGEQSWICLVTIVKIGSKKVQKMHDYLFFFNWLWNKVEHGGGVEKQKESLKKWSLCDWILFIIPPIKVENHLFAIRLLKIFQLVVLLASEEVIEKLKSSNNLPNVLWFVGSVDFASGTLNFMTFDVSSHCKIFVGGYRGHLNGYYDKTSLTSWRKMEDHQRIRLARTNCSKRLKEMWWSKNAL